MSDYKTVIAYKCCLIDENGVTRHFEAYGMSSITGDVSKIDLAQLKRLFPDASEQSLRKLERGSTVDVLIGLCQASWQPKRVEKAIGGGDFWLHQNIFGSCVGGRHPDIQEDTRRNNDLFFVNHVYHTTVRTIRPPPSHELEYCYDRIQVMDDSSSDPTHAGCSVPLLEEPVHAEGSSSAHLNLPEAVYVVAKVFIKDESHPAYCVCGAAITSPFGNEDLFFKAESLGTLIEPRCGDCK